MSCQRAAFSLAIPALFLVASSPAAYAQKTTDGLHSGATVTEHAECSYFTEAQRQKSLTMAGVRSRLTEQVTRMRMAQADSSGSAQGSTKTAASFAPNGGNTSNTVDTSNMGTIDRNIFQALAQAGAAHDGSGVFPPRNARSHRPRSYYTGVGVVPERPEAGQARDLHRYIAGVAAMGGQVDHVLRRHVPEYDDHVARHPARESGTQRLLQFHQDESHQ